MGDFRWAAIQTFSGWRPLKWCNSPGISGHWLRLVLQEMGRSVSLVRIPPHSATWRQRASCLGNRPAHGNKHPDQRRSSPQPGSRPPACQQRSTAQLPCCLPAPACLPFSSDGASYRGSRRSPLWNGRFQPGFPAMASGRLRLRWVSSYKRSQPAARGRRAIASVMADPPGGSVKQGGQHCW
jgi:hypothetical protein